MAFLPIKLPPGIYRPGTKYDARGRWYHANLVRWNEGAMQPFGGWSQIADAGAPVRGMLAWVSGGVPLLAVGTFQKAYVWNGSILDDITPATFTAGNENQTSTAEAASWQFDNYGAHLVGCLKADGRILRWNGSGDFAALTNAPTSCSGVVVTPERFVVALGAGGDPRKVQWSDQEGETTWTPTANNQAGDFVLATHGEIMAGRRSRSETLIWTSADLWAMRYIGGQFVYTFQQMGQGCGAISRHAMAVFDGKAVWMSRRGFFVYDGYVRKLPCEVGDYVFSGLNLNQASKVCCVVNHQHNEVIWFYPAGGAPENTDYVAWNYIEDHWTIGTLPRSAGVDAGVFDYPIWAAPAGDIYAHETGNSYIDSAGGAYTPFADSGPIELGNGDQVMMVRQIIPDANTLGDVTATIFASFYPVEVESAFGPFTLSNPTSVRLTGRWVRLRVTHGTAGWRVGTIRLDVVPGGLR